MTLALLSTASGCAHLSDPCDNKTLKQTPSPDGSLVLSTYHRECRSAIYTFATVEKPAGAYSSRGEIVCYLVTWRDRHPIDAVWKGAEAIAISTPDRLEKFDVQEPKDSCGRIKVTYAVQFRNERQETDDPAVIAGIRQLVSELGPCINAYYKAGSPSDTPVSRMNEAIDRGEHRSAVELLLGYTLSSACPLSPQTYGAMKEVSERFDLKPGYLAGVTPLVRR